MAVTGGGARASTVLRDYPADTTSSETAADNRHEVMGTGLGAVLSSFPSFALVAAMVLVGLALMLTGATGRGAIRRLIPQTGTSSTRPVNADATATRRTSSSGVIRATNRRWLVTAAGSSLAA